MLKLGKVIPPILSNGFSILGLMPLHINIRIHLSVYIKTHGLI